MKTDVEITPLVNQIRGNRFFDIITPVEQVKLRTQRILYISRSEFLLYVIKSLS